MDATNAKGFTIPLSARREPQNRRPVLLIGDCERTPYTEAEAMEELRKAPGVGTWCAARCLICFSEDGAACRPASNVKLADGSTKTERIHRCQR
jgi:hypothetical protein